MAKSSTLAKIHTAMQSPNPAKISAAELHQAYRDIGKVAGGMSREAGEVRRLIASYIERGLGKNGISKFRDLNKKWGNLEDLETVWTNGGQGFAGTVTPASIVKYSGKLPGGQNINDAAQIIGELKLSNLDLGKTPELSLSGLLRGGGSLPIVKDAIRLSQASAVNAPPAVKDYLELLRRATPMTFREAYAKSEEQ